MKRLNYFVQISLITLFCLINSQIFVFGQFHNRPRYDTTTVQGIQYRTEVSGLVSSNNSTPFWFRSNQFGTVPGESPTGLITLGANGLWGNANQNRKPYLKAGIEVVGNLNRSSKLVLPEAYLSLRLGHGELYIGRRKEINGLTDTLLTSGSIAWSGNALPITQIRLGTRDFAPLKFTKGLISVNAFISHGWFTNTDSMQNVLLHAKSVFLRIGKPDWKFRLYGGINHFAQWGGYSKYLPPVLAQNGHLATNWQAYKRVVIPFGAPGGDGQFSTIDTLNQIGNHLGSIDLGTDIQLRQSNLFLYYQHIFEDNSGITFRNFPDGLFGVRWKNLSTSSNRAIQLKQITVEFLTTLNRSGTDTTYGGDDYFYNAQYINGWTNQGNIIGTPIFTKTTDIPASIKRNNAWFNRTTGIKGLNIVRPINNSAVQTVHVGLYALILNKIPIVLLVTSNKYYEWPELKKSYSQLDMSLEMNNIFLNRSSGIKAGIKLAYDTGDIFSNNFGAMLMIRKEGMFSQ